MGKEFAEKSKAADSAFEKILVKTCRQIILSDSEANAGMTTSICLKSENVISNIVAS